MSTTRRTATRAAAHPIPAATLVASAVIYACRRAHIDMSAEEAVTWVTLVTYAASYWRARRPAK